MVADDVQSRLVIRNPFKHNAVLAVYGEAKESFIFAVQLVYFKSLMITSFSEQLYLLKRNLLQLRAKSFQLSEELRRESDGNHTVRIS